MKAALPPVARALVDATLAAAQLPGRDGDVVRRELESHFLDGMDAGVPLAELAARFGDPHVTGRLIRRARRKRSRAAALALHLTAFAAACYVLAVARLHSAPAGEPRPAIEREANEVAQLAMEATRGLDTPVGVRAGFRVALALRERDSFWGDAASAELLDRTMSAALVVLPCAELERWRTELGERVEAGSLRPRPALAEAAAPVIAERVYGASGRADRGALRLMQRTKGVVEPATSARLLEPLYFAAGRSRSDVRAGVDRLVTERYARASRAALRLERLARSGSASREGCDVRRADRPRTAAPAGRG
jgi:hypothetical protein